MNTKERFDLTHEVAKYIVKRFQNPNDWPLVVRSATEELGLDPAMVLPLGGVTLYTLCAEVVRTAVQGWEMDAERIRAGFKQAVDRQASTK